MGFNLAAINGMVPPFYHMANLVMLSADLFAFYFGDINDSGGTSDGSGK